ncbi:MAG: glycosyltransferase family 4 protein [Gemmatimonadaceae bacterium]|nr:glycosyltransferase family 4 protein [Gemmatimonadaceae bacterium]
MANDSGIGTYIRNLVPRIAVARADWRFTLVGHAAALRTLGWADLRNVELRDCTAPIYSLREQAALRLHLDADLVWSPHWNIPLLYRGPLVVTVHDVAHLALRDVVRGPLKRGYARVMFTAVGRRANAIICDSDFTRRELRRHVPRVRAEPVVVPLGVGAEWHTGRSGERPHPRPYVVYVGNVKPHKNLGALVRAFADIAADVPHDLVIVGRREGMRTTDTQVQERAATLGDRIVFTGELPADLLRQYVAWADALVLPSLYEGFGLPPLEAMAAGCPTLVSRAGSLPEVCGDASLYCDPLDVADVGRQLIRLLRDESLQEDLRTRGRAHVAAYTWERSAERTLAVLDGAMAGALARR